MLIPTICVQVSFRIVCWTVLCYAVLCYAIIFAILPCRNATIHLIFYHCAQGDRVQDSIPSHQFIVGPTIHTHTHGQLESPVNLISSTVGGRETMQAQEEHANSMLVSNPQLFCCEVPVLTTASLCRPGILANKPSTKTWKLTCCWSFTTISVQVQTALFVMNILKSVTIPV